VLPFAFSKGKLPSCCLRAKTWDKSVYKEKMIEQADSQNYMIKSTKQQAHRWGNDTFACFIHHEV